MPEPVNEAKDEVTREQKIEALNKKIDDIYQKCANAAFIFKNRLDKIKFPQKLYYLISHFECQFNCSIMGAPIILNKMMNSNRVGFDQIIDICALKEWKNKNGKLIKNPFGGELNRVDLDLILLTEIEAFVTEMEKIEKLFQDNIKSTVDQTQSETDLECLLNKEFEKSAKEFMDRETIIKELLQPIVEIELIDEAQRETIDEIYLQLQIKFRTLIMIGSPISIERLKTEYDPLIKDNKIIRDNLELGKLLTPLANIKAENAEIAAEIKQFIINIRKKFHNTTIETLKIESFIKEISYFEKQIAIKNLEAYNANIIALTLKSLAHFIPKNHSIKLEVKEVFKKLNKKLLTGNTNPISETYVLKYLLTKLIPTLFKNLEIKRKLLEQELSVKELSREDIAKLNEIDEQDIQIRYFELQTEACCYPNALRIQLKLSDLLLGKMDNKTATEEEVRQYLRINKMIQEMQPYPHLIYPGSLTIFSGITGLKGLLENNASDF